VVEFSIRKFLKELINDRKNYIIKMSERRSKKIKRK
jgi:hypothetical protein